MKRKKELLAAKKHKRHKKENNVSNVLIFVLFLCLLCFFAANTLLYFFEEHRP
jgi:hypothetical protein